jgi:methionyl aminopeptidase
LDEKILENYLKAGEINKKAQKKALTVIQENVLLLDAVEEIEDFIKKNHAKLAFPVNISINEIAAHFTPSNECKQKFQANDLIKVDIGTAVEGFIADAAFSISFNKKHDKLIQASKNALEAGVKKFNVDVELKEIGKVIEKEIKSLGFNPIQNLSGHGLKKGVIHAPPNIPNIANNDDRVIEDNEAYAIEPFACNGEGFVREGIQTEIFELKEVKPIRNMHARKILEFIEKEFDSFPFALRQIQKELKLSEFNLKFGLKELQLKEIIKSYPVLKEKDGILVSQNETSLIAFNKKIHRLV